MLHVHMLASSLECHTSFVCWAKSLVQTTVIPFGRAPAAQPDFSGILGSHRIIAPLVDRQVASLALANSSSASFCSSEALAQLSEIPQHLKQEGCPILVSLQEL